MKALTDKQARALDALRNGGTIADVAARLDLSLYMAGKVAAKLRSGGYLAIGRPLAWDQPAQLSLTTAGRAAHLGSLK